MNWHIAAKTSRTMRFYLLLICLSYSLIVSGQAAQSPERHQIQSLHYKINSKRTGKAKQVTSMDEIATPSKDLKESNSADMEMERNSKVNVNMSELDWLNLYQEQRNASLSDDGKIDIQERKVLTALANESQASKPNSFAANYLLLRQNRNNNKAQSYFTSASQLNPTSALLPAEAAWLAERKFEYHSLNKALIALKANGTISNFQSAYARWIIDALPEGSLLVTNGEFDTYPVWEQLKNKKIHIISLAMIEDKEWLTDKLKAWDPTITDTPASETAFFNTLLSSSKPSFLSLTLRQDILQLYQSNLFPVGPMCRFARAPQDNVEQLKGFYAQKNMISFLESSNWKYDTYSVLAKNLLPGLDALMHWKGISEVEKTQLEKLQNVINTSLSNR
ncbi:MAG: hypothetical protein RLZZ543_498 [Bacteroidota bacterium]|jgi:hypothetical protein